MMRPPLVVAILHAEDLAASYLQGALPPVGHHPVQHESVQHHLIHGQ